MSFMGVMMAGGATAGIYTTNGPEACKYVTSHSGAVVVVAEDAAQVAKFAAFTKEDCPNLKVGREGTRGPASQGEGAAADEVGRQAAC